MHSLYILLCDGKTFYVGVTEDLSKRLKEHTSGYSPHTKRYQSIKLVYQEVFPTRLEAENREKQLKGWSRAKKQALIDGNTNKLIELSKSRP